MGSGSALLQGKEMKMWNFWSLVSTPKFELKQTKKESAFSEIKHVILSYLSCSLDPTTNSELYKLEFSEFPGKTTKQVLQAWFAEL